MFKLFHVLFHLTVIAILLLLFIRYEPQVVPVIMKLVHLVDDKAGNITNIVGQVKHKIQK